MFSATLIRPSKNDEKTREKTREKIIHAISENEKITTEELAIVSGFSVKGVEYHLQKLKKEGIIKHKGSDKGGCWVLIWLF
jgi:ATP-dependent DNA helicase RecG